jgi:hypothetical protein
MVRRNVGYKTRDENMKRITDDPSATQHISLSQAQQAELRTDSLGEKLNVMINHLPTSGVSLAEIRDIVGQDGLLVLITFLAIVFMVPVSIPGVSTVFGATILMIGTSRLLGCNLWLPKCIAQRVLPTEKLLTGLNQSSIWLHRLERLSRPHRMNWLTSNWLAEILNNCALINASALLIAPFGLIPFSNTLPALALLFLAIGLLQHDGLCILFGHIANLCAFIYFTSILAGGSAAIRQALWHVMEKAS